MINAFSEGKEGKRKGKKGGEKEKRKKGEEREKGEEKGRRGKKKGKRRKEGKRREEDRVEAAEVARARRLRRRRSRCRSRPCAASSAPCIVAPRRCFSSSSDEPASATKTQPAPRRSLNIIFGMGACKLRAQNAVSGACGGHNPTACFTYNRRGLTSAQCRCASMLLHARKCTSTQRYDACSTHQCRRGWRLRRAPAGYPQPLVHNGAQLCATFAREHTHTHTRLGHPRLIWRGGMRETPVAASDVAGHWQAIWCVRSLGFDQNCAAEAKVTCLGPQIRRFSGVVDWSWKCTAAAEKWSWKSGTLR